MVDHIHFPKSLAPLFPTEKIKKVGRRKDKKQDAAFKENLEKEKKNADDEDGEDSYEPGHGTRRAGATGDSNEKGSERRPSSIIKKRHHEDPDPERKIDVHA